MVNTVIDNYLWTIKTDFDNRALYDHCLFSEQIIKEKFPVPAGTYGSASTAAFKHYNIFTFVGPSMVQLYHTIADHVRPLLPNTDYAIQAWLNVFRTGEYIDWHNHWSSDMETFHGYYCVHVGNSRTSYRLENQIYAVDNRDSMIVVGRSNGDEHRSSEWTKPEPRVTIAFDIVPVKHMDIVKRDFDINHFIPL